MDGILVFIESLFFYFAINLKQKLYDYICSLWLIFHFFITFYQIWNKNRHNRFRKKSSSGIDKRRLHFRNMPVEFILFLIIIRLLLFLFFCTSNFWFDHKNKFFYFSLFLKLVYKQFSRLIYINYKERKTKKRRRKTVSNANEFMHAV